MDRSPTYQVSAGSSRYLSSRYRIPSPEGLAGKPYSAVTTSRKKLRMPSRCRIGSEEVLNFQVSGEKIQAVHMLPGYTHNIITLSDTEDLVTLMWANEAFDPKRPDTFFEKVEE